MNTQLCSFEQAKRLKALWFDWNCTASYQKETKELTTQVEHSNTLYYYFCAPTVALALKWFRDTKKIMAAVGIDCNGKYSYHATVGSIFSPFNSENNFFDDYDLAESTLLDELLTEYENKNSHG